MKGEEEAEKQWSKEELAEAIKNAVFARAHEFKAQASTLTFEGARRTIEQDLCMKRLSLDAHKKFVKRCVEECLSGDGGEQAPEPSGSSMSKSEKSTTEEPEGTRNTSDIKNTGASNSDEIQASGSEIINDGNGVSTDMIKEAIKERASFFKQHQESITYMKVRRLLEEDLNLPVKTLDVHKAFINAELHEVFASLEKDTLENGAQKKPKKTSNKVEKAQKRACSKRTREESDSSDNGNKEEEHSEEEVKPKKRKQAVSKVKATVSTQKSASRKNSVEEKKKSTVSKSKEVAKKEREDNSDEEKEGGNSSDKNESSSSDKEEGAEKKREKPAQVYGKKVERLKSIIKSCGLSIPPAVYRRAKQAPEDRRETVLVKELEEILEKEGLSSNPSEKEIKEVKRKKERAKELEGIDMSNIITSSRRRSSAFSYIPPPKPLKIESSSDDDDDEDDDEDDVSDDDNDVDLEKGDLNGNDDDGDGDDGGEHGGDEDNDDGNEGKESDQDGVDDNN